MRDPYEILGVSINATDDEIKSAYKELVKTYHPDQYQNSPLAKSAEEKMAEINSAYDQINKQRKRGGNSSYSNNSGYSSYSNSGYSSNNYGGSTVNYMEIRQLIQSGNITRAESLLSSVPMNQRDAEWNFLMGSVAYQRGWLEQAYSFYTQAYQSQPYNNEYRQAYEFMNQQNRGNMRGNPMPHYRNGNSNDACDCCCQLWCMDSCCECMGGDCIPCI